MSKQTKGNPTSARFDVTTAVRAWPETRLRFVVSLNPSRSAVAALAPETEVSFVPMDAVGENGAIRLDQTRLISDVLSGYTFFADGDVVIAKITPCFENGKGALATGLRNGVAFGTTELIVVRPRPERSSGPYLHWVFNSPDFRSQATAAMYGAGGQKRVPDEVVRDYVIALPPLIEQKAIANFLDQETAKIDALVAEQEHLIGLLNEKRRAVISNAVTKGLDPSVSMKGSGFEWIRDIPAHWTASKVKFVSTFTTSGPRGWSERIADEGPVFVQSGDLGDSMEIDFGAAKRVRVVDSEDSEAARTSLREGDVLVCITGAKTGNVALCSSLPESAYINQHLCLIRPDTNILPSFLGLALKSPVGQMYFDIAQYGL